MLLGIWGSIPSQEIVYEMEKQLTQARIQNWINQDLFSYQWWILLGALVIPWWVWWKYVDKNRLIEITLLGLMTWIITSFLDAVLSELGLWEYNFYVIPLWPCLISADFSIMPVTYMFVYQYFRDWKKFIPAMLVVSLLFTFAGETLLVWLKIYTLHGWKHYYSLPIYLALGAVAKSLTDKISFIMNRGQ